MPASFPYSVFRCFLWIPKIRKWYAKLHTPGRLLGAAVSDEKLWYDFKYKVVSFLTLWTLPLIRLYRKNTWLQFKTVCVRARISVSTAQPVQLHKKFIITLTSLPQSVQVAERCLASARQHGEEQGLEIAPAIDKFEAQEFFRRHGITWYHLDYNLKAGKDPLPEMGCFASHYTLWQRCIDFDEPIVILEHDAIFVAPLPALKFKHVMMLSRFEYQMNRVSWDALKNSAPREVFHPMHRLPTGHGYAVTPAGARRLVEAAHRQLVTPTDSFITKSKVDILCCQPHPIDFDSRFSTIDMRPKCTMTPEKIWEQYKR